MILLCLTHLYGIYADSMCGQHGAARVNFTFLRSEKKSEGLEFLGDSLLRLGNNSNHGRQERAESFCSHYDVE